MIGAKPQRRTSSLLLSCTVDARITLQVLFTFRELTYFGARASQRAMSTAPTSDATTAKATAADKQTTEQAKDVRPTAALEEDDEFEDFPVEGMSYDSCKISQDVELRYGFWYAELGMLT